MASVAHCRALMRIVADDLRIDLRSVETTDLDFFAANPPSSIDAVGQSVNDVFAELIQNGPQDVDTYFSCLASLFKARVKFETIQRKQPLPTLEQVGPRGLVQYGQTPSPRALTALLIWRKWFFDFDNRAAQETGYLFEPILAASIGGVPFSSAKSPIRRSSGSGGRQVDCVRDTMAYEFKLRVTIAASGQGRWAEEVSFPHESRQSGFTPILIVFDGTPNPKLAELVRAFETVGGHSFVGVDAWAHLEDAAGPTMREFLERYIRKPLDDLLSNGVDERALPALRASIDGSGALTFAMGDEQWSVERSPDPMLADVEVQELPEDVDDLAPGNE